MARLTDPQLLAKAQEHAELKAQIAKLEADAKKAGEAIVGELAARKKADVELGGLKIAVIVTTRTVYNPDKARQLLKPAQYRRLTRTTIPAALVKEEIKAGLLTEQLAAKFATVTNNAAYPDIRALKAA